MTYDETRIHRCISIKPVHILPQSQYHILIPLKLDSSSSSMVDLFVHRLHLIQLYSLYTFFSSKKYLLNMYSVFVGFLYNLNSKTGFWNFPAYFIVFFSSVPHKTVMCAVCTGDLKDYLKA